MPEYTHGGDLTGAETAYGGVVLDFSANLNPLGMPERVRRAAAESIVQAVHYPDPFCRRLKGAIARHDGVAQEHIFCGNGAADVIFRLAHALGAGRALVTAPTFSEYEQALLRQGCQVERFPLRPERNFDLTEDFLEAVHPSIGAVFLCTPNNPTGRLISQPLLMRILERCRVQRARLVVDECFLPLSDGAGTGMAPLLGEYPELVLLRAFTKSYAVPGLRLGYALCADGALLEAAAEFGQPWSVSTPAQAAGTAALEECPYWPEEARALLRVQRPELKKGLEELGLAVTPGQANYLLFRAAGVTDLKERLLQKGLLIRSCANYNGLGGDYYRVCVRTGPENRRLLAAIKEAL